MRFIRFINPKPCRAVALNKLTSAEKGLWYLHLVIFLFQQMVLKHKLLQTQK
jgi:polyphosphate kinase 2 (PPK2 family)